MSFLINRAPTARLKCLHILMKFIISKFDLRDEFYMGDLLYDRTKANIHNFCDLLIIDQNLGLSYCPYLKNPLSEAGCNITNGVISDSTKKKEISNTLNSLDALGFLNRINGGFQITDLGLSFAKTNFQVPQMREILINAVLNYGLCIGVLSQIKQLNKAVFSTNEIFVGYPSTLETVFENNQIIKISSGSQEDSNTRTKSCILAWLTACGFIIPSRMYTKELDLMNIHSIVLHYIMAKNRNQKFYQILDFPDFIFDGNFIVNNPLDYENFTKNTGALRENGQQASRETTMKFEKIIKNRRLALVYILNNAFLKKRKVRLNRLISFLKEKPNLFIIDIDDFERVMAIELNFANVCGIPFEVLQDSLINPLVSVNEKELCLNAPKEVINYLDSFRSYE